MKVDWCQLKSLRANTPFRPHPSCLGKINKGIREYKSPTPVKFYIRFRFTFIEDLQKQFNSPTPAKLLDSLKIVNKGSIPPTRVKLLHSLKAFNESLILPPPLNFYIHWRSSIRAGLILPPPLNFYIHWRPSMRV